MPLFFDSADAAAIVEVIGIRSLQFLALAGALLVVLAWAVKHIALVAVLDYGELRQLRFEN